MNDILNRIRDAITEYEYETGSTVKVLPGPSPEHSFFLEYEDGSKYLITATKVPS